MPATHRTSVVRPLLSAAALAASLFAAQAHAGLLGGGGGFAGGVGGGLSGGMGGTLSSRQIDVGGRATGQANGAVNGTVNGQTATEPLKRGVDKAQGKVDDVQQGATQKAAEAKAMGQNLNDQSSAAAMNGSATGTVGVQR